MEEEKKKAYSEVIEILKLIEDEEKIEKIPLEVVELIKRNSDPTYKPEISKEIPLEEQNLRNETYAIIGWIADKYWGEKIYEVKENSIEQSNSEENIEENTVRNAAVYNDMDTELIEKAENESNLPAIVSEIKWYEKLKSKVIKFLKIIFRLNKENTQEGEI